MTTPEPIITPIVHRNGDTLDTLLTQLADAYHAVRQAMISLQEYSPNGRNYYLENGRLQKAQAQHAARFAHLEAVSHSLEAEAIQLQDEQC